MPRTATPPEPNALRVLPQGFAEARRVAETTLDDGAAEDRCGLGGGGAAQAGWATEAEARSEPPSRRPWTRCSASPTTAASRGGGGRRRGGAARAPSRLERREGLPEGEVFQDQFPAGSEGRHERPDDDPDDAEHGRRTLPGRGQKISGHAADGVLATNRRAAATRSRMVPRPIATSVTTRNQGPPKAPLSKMGLVLGIDRKVSEHGVSITGSDGVLSMGRGVYDHSSVCGDAALVVTEAREATVHQVRRHDRCHPPCPPHARNVVDRPRRGIPPSPAQDRGVGVDRPR